MSEPVRQTPATVQAAPPPSPPRSGDLFPERLGLTPMRLLELAPRLEPYVLGKDPGWPAIVMAADWLRGELGISAHLWRQACAAMGEAYAAVAVALVSTRAAGHFTSSAGGYFAGMLRKYEAGNLHLDRTLWRLRDEKWGKRARQPAGSMRRPGARVDA
jgi:replication initiation protein RepC